MRDQKTYALVAQFGEAAARNVDGVQPCGDGDEGNRKESEPLHGYAGRVGAGTVEYWQTAEVWC